MNNPDPHALSNRVILTTITRIDATPKTTRPPSKNINNNVQQ